MRNLILLMLVGAHLLGGTPLWGQRALLSESFDDRNSSDLVKKMEAEERIRIVEGKGTDGSAAAEVTYEPTRRGSDRISLYIPLPKRVTEASLSYEVKFDRGFEFVRGGKLPGLCPDEPVSGGNRVKKDNWSARIMWHGKDPAITTYLYHQDQPEKTGDRRKAEEFRFETGRYYLVTLHVKVNSDAEKADGFAVIYVDGRKVVEHLGVRFRETMGSGTEISQLMFNTFHGGGDPSWAPSKRVVAWFDNIQVYPGRVIREPAP